MDDQPSPAQETRAFARSYRAGAEMVLAALAPEEQLLAVTGLCCAPDASVAFASLLNSLCKRAPVVAVTNLRVAVATPLVGGSGRLVSWPLADVDGAVEVLAHRDATPFAQPFYVLRIATRQRSRQERHELRGVDRREFERVASMLRIARAKSRSAESARRRSA